MRTAVIQNKSLFDSGRIDPSYHLSESIKLKKQLLGSPYTLSIIGEKSEDVFLGNIFTRVFVKDAEHGIPYIAASDMTKASIDSGKFISKNQAKKLKRLMLDSGWILISCSGTLGNVVYTNDLFKNTFATHDLIRLIPDDKKMPSGFLYAYLASKYGYTLLTQSGFGGVVKHINPDHVANIPIPLFPESKQKEIHNLIVESANLRVEANRLLEEATECFDELLKDEGVDKNGAISIGNIRNRFDSFSVLENSSIDKIIKKHPIEWIPIKSISEKIFIGPRSKRNYVAKGIPFLSGSELQKSNPTKVDKFLNIKDAALFIVKKDWILITRSGTIGNVSYVLPILNGYGATDDAIRVVVKSNSKLTSKYLYAFLASKFGKKCIQKDIFGSVIQHINEEQLGNIFMPILDVYKIERQIEKYCLFLNEAIIKENEAISLVEKEIESWRQS